jgi:hypothetical protein
MDAGSASCGAREGCEPTLAGTLGRPGSRPAPAASFEAMPLRRILVVLLLLMIVMSIATSLNTRDDDTATAPAVAPAQDAQARTLSATLPRERPVRAAVGDHILLTVAVDAADQVQIDGYDLAEPVDPQTPAQFDFLASQEGRFAVTQVASGRVLGHLEIVVRP